MLLNRKTMAAVLFMAVTACLSFGVAADDSDVFRSKAKYMKYVGTYYTDSGGQTVTIHSDGTQTTVPANMFSQYPETGAVRRTTPAQGVWREIGKNEIQITNIRFWTDALGNDYRPDGLIEKATFVAVFDEPVRGQSLRFTVVDGFLLEVFSADKNPITDEPTGVITAPGGYIAYRLQTVQPGS